MIKVLNIISDTNIGGAGRAVLNYLKYMDRDSFSASVVLPRGSILKEQAEAQNVKVYEIDAMADKSFDLSAVKKLRRVILEDGPDIVHTHGSLSGRIAGKKCGKPVVFTRHSAFPFPGYIRKTPLKLVYRFLYEHFSDKIIAISPAGAEILTDGGISQDKIEVMMNGAEPLEKYDREKVLCEKEKLGIGENDFVLGIVARIEDYKGHIDILEALRELSNERGNIKLIIAGTGSFEETVKRKTEELGLLDKVIFTGFVEDVARVMNVLDVQLNASYVSETSSLSLVEGMSIGVPVLATDCSGNPWLVKDGVSGFLFEPHDSRKLAELISKLMDDRSLLERLSLGAEEEYKNKFTGQIFADNLEDIYRRMLDRRRGK